MKKVLQYAELPGWQTHTSKCSSWRSLILKILSSDKGLREALEWSYPYSQLPQAFKHVSNALIFINMFPQELRWNTEFVHMVLNLSLWDQ